MGGEKMGVGCPEYILLGLPPRRRGKAERAAGRHRPAGITSAWAGKRLTRPAMTGTPRDYPRVGGEKRPAEIDSVASLGSPPHRRGKAFSVLRRQFRFRITPAHTGKRTRSWRAYGCPWDHPRVGGEKVALVLMLGGFVGSPPRRRGKRPAWRRSRWPWRDHPRVGGEKPFTRFSEIAREGSPPRWRGKAEHTGKGAAQLGITPA